MIRMHCGRLRLLDKIQYWIKLINRWSLFSTTEMMTQSCRSRPSFFVLELTLFRPTRNNRLNLIKIGKTRNFRPISCVSFPDSLFITNMNWKIVMLFHGYWGLDLSPFWFPSLTQHDYDTTLDNSASILNKILSVLEREIGLSSSSAFNYVRCKDPDSQIRIMTRLGMQSYDKI